MPTNHQKLKSVCMLVTNIDAPSGGVQKNSRLLLGEYSRLGIKTYVCARNYHNLPRSEIKEGTNFRRSPIFGNSLLINSVIYLIDSFFWLIVNRKKYDVIHCQQMFAPTMIASIANFIVRKPILTRITSSGLIGEANEIRRLPLTSVRLKLLERISKYVVLNKEMKEEIEILGIPSKKINIIYNATQLPSENAFNKESRKNFRSRLKLHYEKIAVFVGRLSEEKGLDTLVNAWKIVNEKFPQAHLLLLGEGGAYRNVEKETREVVEQLNLKETVHFLGHVQNAKDFILASDVFVLPSRAEGMSNALVEAMACGSAIVATDIEANREICQNEINSLLVKTNDAEELASAIIRIFDSPIVAEKLAKQARMFAAENLSVENMTARYINLYQQMMNDN